jgi:NitT/TauT family transport system substrate-binding protein
MAALTSIKTLSDLRGKKVGSVAGSSTDYLWYLVERKLKIPESGLQIVGMPPPELVPSLDRGDIDAFFCWEPWPSRAVEISGKDKVHILANSGDIGYQLNFIVVANKTFVDSKPDVTVRVLAALHDAIDYQNKNPTDAAQIGGSRNNLKPDQAAAIIKLYKYSLGISGQLTAAATAEEGWMRSKERLKGAPIDWSKTIDRSYLDKAMVLK